jgi:hypothetical protein
MKITQRLQGVLILFIISALLFINVIPSFADNNLNYYYDNGNRLIFIEKSGDTLLVFRGFGK